MKNLKILPVLLIVITLQSCFKDDPLPTTGENSFTVKLNGRQYIAEDLNHFASINYGITALVDDKSWWLRFGNSSYENISIYLHEVKKVGYYAIGANDDLFPDSDSESTISSITITNHTTNSLYYTNLPELNEKIEITKIEGDSLIIGNFEKITLSDPDNPDEIIILTNGKFNINRTTLNFNKNDL